jgi:hypothetical protein
MRNLRHRALFLALFVATMASAQPSSSIVDRPQTVTQSQAKKYSNPVEFFLHRFNPDDIDYGERIEEMRESLLADTVQSPFFWSIAWGAVLLIGSLAMVVHLEQERKHRHLIAARFLAWYHNQLLDARAHALEELGKFNRLRQAVDERDMAAAASATQGGQRQASSAGKDLITENNSLRQKMSLMENAEKVVRQENTELKRLLRQAQQKNLDSNQSPAAQGKDDKNGK